MNPSIFSLVLTALCLIPVAALARRRAFLEVAPSWRRFLRELGLTDARQFLELRALIVSGHPDRHVARVRLGSGAGAVTAYLKREHHVPWKVRLASALAGFGLVSRSVREARVLQALSREDLGVPEWLAAGEDGEGRAFLLVREVEDAVDLRCYLRDELDAGRRRAVAGRLGALLARLHDAGFEHPDLYAKHVLVRPQTHSIHLLDWQRARRRRALGWRARGRGLAALHATLDPRLATGTERRYCLRAYFAAAQQHPEEPITPGRLVPPAAPRRAARLRLVLSGLRARLRRLLARRHVREKRQLPGPAQAWTCLADGALCVTPAMQERCPDGIPHWLPLEAQPAPAGGPVSRRWLDLPNGSRTLLVRRKSRSGWQGWWQTLRGQPVTSPEHQQASVLLRLERHGVAAARVLALGQRRHPTGAFESFLLTEPPSATMALDVWLHSSHQGVGAAEERSVRREVLAQAGGLLGRLHGATCYLGRELAGCGLAVRLAPGEGPSVVLQNAEQVRALRRRSPGREWQDLMRMQRLLSEAGCGRTELRRFRVGYRKAMPRGSRRPRRLRVASPPASSPTLPLTASSLSLPRSSPRPCGSGPETLWQRLAHGVRRLRQRPDWPLYAGADWPDRIMNVEVTDRYHAKQGRSTARWVLPPPDGGRGLTVYIKRHYRLSLWQGLLAALWPRSGWSPALKEWRHLEWARRQGVPVPEVVAAAEYIGPWGRLQSFLAVEELAGMIALDEAIPKAAACLAPAQFRRWKRGLTAEMARVARLLHDRGVFHKDLYLCHFYIAAADVASIPAAGWHGRVSLIDLHRLAHHPWTWRMWQLKDLAQLIYSSEIVGVDTRDRLWFWHAYRGTGPRRGAERWLRRWVWLKWQRYRRHNARHRGVSE
jgi:heptose I phosphotransferase